MTGWGVTPNAVRGLLFKSRRWIDPPRTPPKKDFMSLGKS